MTVRAILSSKGSDVTTTEPTATLESAIGILAERGIGALVVLGADHRVIGILSERDVVRALAGASGAGHDAQDIHLHSVRRCEYHYGADDRRQVPPRARG